jgi:hypothetical protein
MTPGKLIVGVEWLGLKIWSEPWVKKMNTYVLLKRQGDLIVE